MAMGRWTSYCLCSWRGMEVFHYRNRKVEWSRQCLEGTALRRRCRFAWGGATAELRPLLFYCRERSKLHSYCDPFRVHPYLCSTKTYVSCIIEISRDARIGLPYVLDLGIPGFVHGCLARLHRLVPSYQSGEVLSVYLVSNFILLVCS